MRFSLRRPSSPDEAASGVDPVSIASRWVPGWDRLDADRQQHLISEADAFVSHIRFEAARGFTLTPEVRLAVASTAALLTLELPDGVESYRSVSSVIVHRSTIVRRGARPIGGGLWTDEPDHLAGEAVHRGPVVIAWDSARRHARWASGAENVLVHEFAHRLDMLDGLIDGTPLIGDDVRQRWVEVCTSVYRRLRSGEPSDVLRPYGAKDPGEFFAVASEAFFTVPDALRSVEPDLYDVLAEFYRQDPAAA